MFVAVTDSDPPAASLYFPEFRGATEIIENWSREPKSVLSQYYKQQPYILYGGR